MTRYDEVATRWCERVTGKSTRKRLRNDRMFTSLDEQEIYSYGTHFTIARTLRDKGGNTVAFLLNGDRFSPTTNRHQSVVRDAVRNTGLPSVIVPFSALDAAGIEHDTVEIPDVLPDRTVVTRKVFTEVQPAWQWRNDEIHAYRPMTDTELQVEVDKRNVAELEGHAQRQGWALAEVGNGRYQCWPEYLPGGKAQFTPTTIEAVRKSLSYSWHGGQVRYVERVEQNLYVSKSAHARQVEITYVGGEPIEYVIETNRHWLGESLIRGKVGYTTRSKCKACGGTGAVPYAGPNDWEQACKACDSRFTHQSRGTGRTVRFRKRTALFLSGFDHNETRDLYFFSELPDTKPRTVDEAYEALKPDTVKIAELLGRDVLRQGDIFAIPMLGMDKRALAKLGARFEKGGTLLGTNHVASEVAYLKDGRTFARGTLKHAPEWREADHKRVTLAKGTWHLTMKNTVPTSA